MMSVIVYVEVLARCREGGLVQIIATPPEA
jgi:hypothetical protein